MRLLSEGWAKRSTAEASRQTTKEGGSSAGIWMSFGVAEGGVATDEDNRWNGDAGDERDEVVVRAKMTARIKDR